MSVESWTQRRRHKRRVARGGNEWGEIGDTVCTRINPGGLEVSMFTFTGREVLVCAAVALTALVAGCSLDSPAGAPATSITTVAPSDGTGPPPSESDAATVDGGSGRPPIETAPEAASLPLSAFVEGSGYSFGTPSSQIQCRVSSSTLACQTRGRPHTVMTDSLCKIRLGDEQGRADLFGYLEGGTLPCPTVTQGEVYVSPHTLGYGQRVTFELTQGIAVTCGSATDGLTCTDTDPSNGAAFFLSVDSFTQL